MTTVISWNIQAGLGVDGRTDLPRIAETILALADPDVICLQEIESLERTDWHTDQFRALGELFPGYSAIDGPGVERADETGVYRFGNMVLSRLPVLSVFRHHLPWPVASDVKHMPRQATEATVATSFGPLRIVTTHLEYHARRHRLAQVTRLRDLHAEAAAQNRNPGVIQQSGPYAQLDRASSAVVCGDFNMEVASEEYAAMLAPFDDATPIFTDAWTTVHGDRPHAPTCGIHDHGQWPEGPHCRDFFFITEDLCARLEAIRVDTVTDASDHQPMALILRDTPMDRPRD